MSKETIVEGLTEEQLTAHVPAEGIDFRYVQQPSRADLIINDHGPTYSREDAVADLLPWIAERYWFLWPDYVAKTPHEKWSIRAGSLAVKLYNYLPDREIAKEEVHKIGEGLALFDAHFPIPQQASPRSITVTPRLPAATYPDPKYSPAQAMASSSHHLVELAAIKGAFMADPYCRQLHVPRLQGLIIHELAHFGLDIRLSGRWLAAGFSWSPKLTPQGKQRRRAGDYLYVADQPEACVTEYAKSAVYEDISESVVAYLLMPRLLDATKRRILARRDVKQPVPTPLIRRQRPVIPKLPRHIYYSFDTSS